MAAPNAQPCGSRPTPGTAHEHAPFEGGMPASGANAGMDDEINGTGVAPHGTPAPVGNGKSNPLR